MVHLIGEENKVKTSGNLFSLASRPPVPVLFNCMMDAGKESVRRHQAKKIQCQNTVPDE